MQLVIGQSFLLKFGHQILGYQHMHLSPLTELSADTI